MLVQTSVPEVTPEEVSENPQVQRMVVPETLVLHAQDLEYVEPPAVSGEEFTREGRARAQLTVQNQIHGAFSIHVCVIQICNVNQFRSSRSIAYSVAGGTGMGAAILDDVTSLHSAPPHLLIG